ncbi:RING-H2 finger protein ATL70-like protein [Tanacetum coccineum]
MNTTSVVEQPFSTNIPNPGRHDYLYVVGLFFTILLVFIITYAYHICKRYLSPPTYDDVHDDHLVRFSHGLNDDVLVTFPMFVYSDAKASYKGDTHNDTDMNGSGCSICLADYKPVDFVRLLPECGHLFHVKCIDTWLKTRPTCPVCRNSPLAAMAPPKGGDPNS